MGPPPHPLAGRSGEGPPLAPPNWKWRAGNRISDMYFYSPAGKQFRSRPELAHYLKTLNNPPDASLFCWRVSEEVMKSGVLGEIISTAPKPLRKRKAPVIVVGANKKSKTTSSLLKPSNSEELRVVSIVAEQPKDLEPPSTAPGANLAQNVTSFSPAAAQQHRLADGKERKKRKRVRMSFPHSFRSILAGRSSFRWLYDPETHEKFLEEARRLKHKSATEINEMRQVLVDRDLDLTNIFKYPNSAIRVFLRLLRNEEAPLSMGKADLADLCVNWTCKKRHFWCLLELNRVSASTKSPKMEAIRREDLGPSGGAPSHGLSAEVKGVPIKQNYAADGRGTGNQNGSPSFSGAPRDLQTLEQNLRLPNGDVRLSGEVARGADSTSEIQNEDAQTGFDKSGNSLAFQHFKVSTGEPASKSKTRDVMAHNVDNSDIVERGDSTLQGQKVIPSRDNPGLSEAIDSLSQRKSEVRPGVRAFSLLDGGTVKVTGEIERRVEPIEMRVQRQPEVTSAGEAASDLDGENIIVITGFKSEDVGKPSTTLASTLDADALNRGSTSTSGTKLINPGQGTSPASSSKDGSLRTDFVAMTMSKATESTSLIDGDENLKGMGAATVTRESEGIPQRVQGALQEEEKTRSKHFSLKRDGGGIIERNLSDGLCSVNRKLVMVTSSQTPTTAKDANEEMNKKDRALVGGSEIVVNREPMIHTGSHLNGSRALIPESFKESEEKTEEHFTNGSHKEMQTSAPKQVSPGKESSACWCKICSSDFSFCRGCMCTFCRKSLQPGENWMVVKCICNHVCHIDCAQGAKAAGVVKELELDGELSCPSCSQKVDLLPFFRKRIDLILSLSVSNVNLKSLEKLVFQVVQLLKGTEKRKYGYLEGLLVESYELLRNASFLELVRQLLGTIRDELYTPFDSGQDLDSMEGGLNASVTSERMELLKKEKLARKSLETARSERLCMEKVIEKVRGAYKEALNRREQARSAKTSVLRMLGKPERSQQESSPPVTQEVILLQQAKVKYETQKLWDMRNFEATNVMTFSALDASAEAWLENLKAQRVVLDSAQAELRHLERNSS